MSTLVVPIDGREFDLYALGLSRGPNFEPYYLLAAWRSKDRGSVGAVLVDPEAERFGALTMRRQVDHRFVITQQVIGLRDSDDAMTRAVAAMRPDDPPEPIKPGIKKRPTLLQLGDRKPGDAFKLLASTVTHVPALMAVGEAYLAMPRPDDNFVPDFQAGNFDSRLWELYLLAAFREQGISVSQDYPSPDFLIERDGHHCFVEAVTANPKGNRTQGFAMPPLPPDDPADRMLGPAAVRFAKTLRSKLQREYDKAPHVHGKPFALAIADFHAPSSMLWSREALPTYLYGVHAQVTQEPGGPKAIGVPIDVLRGGEKIPAGLFRDPSMVHLSAVISSNAGTLGKFNRMGYLAGYRPAGLTMVREGVLFDPAPGALQSIPFELDILSEEYAAMWPWGEAWSQELEVYHNPLATHPIDFELLPWAVHWYEKDGEALFSSIWPSHVLASVTHLRLEE